ncbi:MAG: 1-acyl-sn-glycerol-3-phosphate acyltransferase [Bacteroides sp.]|nr:1-acyl-sn-glycerol-3-phosphate acyltransferase [Bacteroides sp.]
MENQHQFDEIRPYHDDELPAIYEELIGDPDFRKAVQSIMPQVPFEAIARKMRTCRTKLEFQKAFCYGILWDITKKYATGLTLDHTAVGDKSNSYTYISNHRDIILDSGFLSILLLDEGMDTVEIAIGDNLLIYPWIKKLVRINKSFIVQRTLTMRQILDSSARMSRYIHYTLTEKNQSVWIAQREGRAKDSDDRTQESVLKMLAMGGEGEIMDRIKELRIVPLSLSYEYDPCDFLKAKEFQLKRDDPEYKKSRKEDLLNMKTGLFGYKGHVHFQVAPCINNQLETLDRSLSKAELYPQIARLIDNGIHNNYRIYPCNYIAYDKLHSGNRFAAYYNPAEKDKFETYLSGQLEKIDLPEKDILFLEQKLLEMYANPLINFLKATE